MGRIIIGTILILWGLSAFLGFSLFKFFFALVIILIGVRILTGRRWGHWENIGAATSSQEESLNEVVIFSPLMKAVKSEKFKGGKITMVFAGGEIDLSQAKTDAKEIDLYVNAIFAGVKIIIPKDWKVNTQGTAIFGGYDSKVVSGESHVTVNLKGSAVFGGIEIVN